MQHKYTVADIKEAFSYRTPMRVTEILVRVNGDAYPVCPKCNITIDREYMRYCDRCGQALDWKHYNKAEIIYR